MRSRAIVCGDLRPRDFRRRPHALTSIGAVTFVGSALVMAVGGWIRFDWSDDDDSVAIVPYASPGGGGVVATF